MTKKELIIYKTDSGIEVEIGFGKDSIWVDTNSIANIFDVKRPAIVKHIQNIYKSEELHKDSTCSILEQVAADGKKRMMNLYNLDMIISIGYRVNSLKATKFRQWATQRLKEHLIQGYTLNQKRLEEYSQNIKELENTVSLIKKAQITKHLKADETKGLLEIITKYTHSFVTLNQFDSDTFSTKNLKNNFSYEIEYQEAKTAILELKNQLIDKKEATNLFANEKDKSFSGILKSIVQTFDGQYLYPSVEEQAAHLLYFVIKNHPFSDGNKRVGAFLFVWFLEKNKHLLKATGELKINETGLTALALLVAQSDPNDKELMIKLIVNLIANME